MNDNHLKTYAIIGVITFLIGIFIGYSLWGTPKKKEKVNVSELLTQALEEVRTIQRENSNLRTRLERLKKSDSIIASLKEENAELMNQIEDLREEKASLEAKLNSLTKDAELLSSLKKQNEELRAKISELQAKASESSEEKISSRGKEIEALKAKIKSLEEENQKLKSVIEQIKVISGAGHEK